jgi:beta-glucanase (GH16 family)
MNRMNFAPTSRPAPSRVATLMAVLFCTLTLVSSCLGNAEGLDERERPETDGGSVTSPDAGMDAGPGLAADAGIADAGVADAGIDVPSGYQLVWSDEFDVPGAPDPSRWTNEYGFVRNHEDQWYQKENAFVQGGLLVIEARKEKVENPDFQAGSSDWKKSRQYAQYTSASLLTAGRHTWRYGRFEMRARIPTHSGMWPAWWTLGERGEWPSNGEVDIMEFYRGMLLANVACGTSTRWVAKWASSTKAISSLGADWSSRFHVWRMDWDDANIALFVDGVSLNTVPLQSMLNPDGTSPLRQPHFMILNLAVGGDNGGDPSATTFPRQYEIDYVRVFQKLGGP